MKRTLLQQTLHTLASILLGQGSLIVAGIAISRVFGPAGKGIVSYAGISIMAAIAVGDGLSAAIARIIGGDDTQAASAYVAARRIVVALSAVLVPPIALIGFFVPSQYALIAVAAALPFALYLQTMNGFHLVAQRVERTNYAGLATNGATGIAELIAIATGRVGVEGLLVIWVVGYVVGALIVARGIHTLARDARPADVRRIQREMVRFSRSSSLASLATFLSVRIDVFIVSALLSAVALGNYTLAIAAGELMWQVSRAISWPSFSRVANAAFEDAAQLTARVSRVVILLEIVMATIAFIFGPWLVKFVYGSAFAEAGVPLRFLLPGMMVYAADAILTYFLSVRANRPGLIVRIELFTLTLCAVATFATVGRFGIIGPAIATTLAYLFSFGVKSVVFSRLTGLPLRDLLVFRPGDFAMIRRARASVAPLPVTAPS